MRIGYYESLDTTPSTQSVRRAVRLAKEALERQGFELVPFKFSEEEVMTFKRISFTLFANFVLGPLSRKVVQSGEKLQPVYALAANMLNFPTLVHSLAKNIMILLGNKRKAALVENCKYRSKEYLDETICLRENWHDIMRAKWNHLGIQAIICPVYPHVAFKIKNALDMNPLMDYTIMYNIFHYPSGSLPVTTVTEQEVRDPANSYKDGIEDNFTRAIRDDMIGSQGMPVSVQVVALSH